MKNKHYVVFRGLIPGGNSGELPTGNFTVMKSRFLLPDKVLWVYEIDEYGYELAGKLSCQLALKLDDN